MNYFVLLFSIVVNLAAYMLYLLFWFVLPMASFALILFTMGRLVLLLTRWLRRSTEGRTSQ